YYAMNNDLSRTLAQIKSLTKLVAGAARNDIDLIDIRQILQYIKDTVEVKNVPSKAALPKVRYDLLMTIVALTIALNRVNQLCNENKSSPAGRVNTSERAISYLNSHFPEIFYEDESY